MGNQMKQRAHGFPDTCSPAAQGITAAAYPGATATAGSHLGSVSFMITWLTDHASDEETFVRNRLHSCLSIHTHVRHPLGGAIVMVSLCDVTVI